MKVHHKMIQTSQKNKKINKITIKEHETIFVIKLNKI
jgi:hypothetical protein